MAFMGNSQIHGIEKSECKVELGHCDKHVRTVWPRLSYQLSLIVEISRTPEHFL